MTINIFPLPPQFNIPSSNKALIPMTQDNYASSFVQEMADAQDPLSVIHLLYSHEATIEYAIGLAVGITFGDGSAAALIGYRNKPRWVAARRALVLKARAGA